MILKKLSVKTFRNYSSIYIDDFEQINLIYGENGQGKTSFIEAIYYTALTQSFKAKTDLDCVNYREEESTFFEIDSLYLNRFNDKEEVRIYYSRKEGKNLFLNGEIERKFRRHIGFIPVVLIKPSDSKITLGSPNDRRKFIDILLSQISPVYLDSLYRYKRIVKHKNALLNKMDNLQENQLLTWNEELVKHGSILIQKRAEIIDEMQQISAQIYRAISGKNQSISLRYSSPLDNVEDIEEQFRAKLNQSMQNEYHQRKSLIGPHRDDFIFLLDDKQIGQFGSQGENKTLLISLKLAELEILKKYIDESPILLFDDIFSELDDFRIEHLMEHIHDVGQIFITTTNENLFDSKNSRKIHIKNGTIAHA